MIKTSILIFISLTTFAIANFAAEAKIVPRILKFADSTFVIIGTDGSIATASITSTEPVPYEFITLESDFASIYFERLTQFINGKSPLKNSEWQQFWVEKNSQLKHSEKKFNEAECFSSLDIKTKNYVKRLISDHP